LDSHPYFSFKITGSHTNHRLNDAHLKNAQTAYISAKQREAAAYSLGTACSLAISGLILDPNIIFPPDANPFLKSVADVAIGAIGISAVKAGFNYGQAAASARNTISQRLTQNIKGDISRYFF